MEVFIDSILEDLIPEYLQGLDDSIALLRNCLSKKDFVEIRREGHKLKGHGKAFGFDFVSLAGARIQDAVDAKDESELEVLINKLELYTKSIVIKYK